jgi:5-oxoprolinase (ATP-hydrolysing)
MKGYDVTKHALSTFGGAGPQHCCAIAKSLGMKKIYVHRYSGILSAFGLSLADIVVEKQEPFSGTYIKSSLHEAIARLDKLEMEAKNELIRQTSSFSAGTNDLLIKCTKFLNCRYQGTDTAIMTCLSDSDASYEEVFISNYKREYGFELTNRQILIDDIRVRAVAIGTNKYDTGPNIESFVPVETKLSPLETVSTYFEGGRLSTPVYYSSSLPSGVSIMGPAIIIQNVATVVIEPGCKAYIYGLDIEIIVEEAINKVVTTTLDPIYLSVFSHRFMGIAEQMGRTLQRTSISVNIK